MPWSCLSAAAERPRRRRAFPGDIGRSARGTPGTKGSGRLSRRRSDPLPTCGSRQDPIREVPTGSTPGSSARRCREQELAVRAPPRSQRASPVRSRQSGVCGSCSCRLPISRRACLHADSMCVVLLVQITLLPTACRNNNSPHAHPHPEGARTHHAVSDGGAGPSNLYLFGGRLSYWR